MNIRINTPELRIILCKYFREDIMNPPGFQILYSEPADIFENRVGKDFSKLESIPEGQISCILNL